MPLTETEQKSLHGAYYTPLEYAQQGYDYLVRTVGDHWWENGYRLWDMAAGTGNLERALPKEALPFVFLSTLEQQDVDCLKSLYPNAGAVFQYDYLNDDIDELFKADTPEDNTLLLFEDCQETKKKLKMPGQLQQALNDDNTRWIVFVNPPYISANEYRFGTENKKLSCSMTRVRQLMMREGFGDASRNLDMQFLWRIQKEFGGRDNVLGLFSLLKYLQGTTCLDFRDRLFRNRFSCGFCFHSRNFEGVRGSYPIGFLVWCLTGKDSLLNKNITIDIAEGKLNTLPSEYKNIRRKTIACAPKEQYLSEWLRNGKSLGQDTPILDYALPYDSAMQNNAKQECLDGFSPAQENKHFSLPVFSSAFCQNRQKQFKDCRMEVPETFLFSLMCNGNSYKDVHQTAICSMPFPSAGAYSVTADTFAKSLVAFTIRKILLPNWLNDRDQFYAPSEPLPNGFLADCALFSLFSKSNHATGQKNIEFEGRKIDLINSLFPFTLQEIKEWNLPEKLLETQDNRDRYLALWLKQQHLSPEADALLTIGKRIYQAFYKNIADIQENKNYPNREFLLALLAKYRIASWDCGWIQVRRFLAETNLQEKLLDSIECAYNNLKQKMRQMIVNCH